MSKQLHITLEDNELADLKRWADGIRPATFAAVVIRNAIAEAKKRGDIPSDENEDAAIGKLALEYWGKIAQGQKLTCPEIIKLAGFLGVNPEHFKQTLEESGLKHDHEHQPH